MKHGQRMPAVQRQGTMARLYLFVSRDQAAKQCKAAVKRVRIPVFSVGTLPLP